MPDPTKQTLSATQTPALWGGSPYVTRWMLWQHFANGVSLDQAENSRMFWGKKLQPIVLEKAADDLKLEVQHNAADVYHRRGRLGCTRDATIICPDRGPGALETKCVFDYATWMVDWRGGKVVPRHYEIQLQQQMFVGDEEKPYDWGVLAAWVLGDIYYFERKPIPDLWAALEAEADQFFAAVADKREPDPFGLPIEVPLLTRLFPTVKGDVLDLTEQEDADKIAEKVALYHQAKEQEAGGRRAAEKLRAELLAVAKEHEEVLLPSGIRVRVSTSKKAAHQVKESVSKSLKVFIPEAGSTTSMPEDLLYAG